MKPLILISNDDGWQAGGINYLIDLLRPVGDLLVVAPDGPRSGYSCAITTQVPMTCRTIREEEGLTVIACTGSPVDCVKVAFNVILPDLYGMAADGYSPARKPDLILGGINHGDNSSVNTYYSGTMGVVTEGTLQGVPSVGLSLCDQSSDADFTACGSYILSIVERVLEEGLPPFSCLNVNFPHPSHIVRSAEGLPQYQGLRVCRMAKSTWIREVARSTRPGSARPIYWLIGEPLELEPMAIDTDRWALAHGYVSVTPQSLDCTDYALLEQWKDHPKRP